MLPTPEIRVIESQPFAQNSYVVWLPGSTAAVVVDPGLEPELILQLLKDENLDVAALLNTHGHADHIGGNRVFKHFYPSAPLVIGANEAHLLTDSNANLSAPFGIPITSPPADRTVRDGDEIEFAGMNFEVREIPGHSPGHVVFIYHGTPVRVFGGDVLFQSGIGRFDFPGGDGDLLLTGIRNKLFTLPDDTIVYPGHGPATTIGREKVANPFLA